MEQNCKWYFKPEGGRDVGPNDPVDEKFKGQPYYSIVREAIQNSLDAIDNEKEPVKVDFSFFELKRDHYPEFFKIEEHIQQCKSYYKNNDNAERLFTSMLDYLNEDFMGEKRSSLSCLRISDYNTEGMSYESGKTESKFYAFLRAGGVSAKSQGSGGSFGFGKGAYYTLSPIKTIIVSTKTNLFNSYFEGSTILTTHKNDDGEMLTAYGYYDNNEGNPTKLEENIPEIFKRKDPGTDVNIIGLWDEPKRKELMIKSVLNNFWFAIHDNKLVVKIDDVLIDKKNLEQIINKEFDGQYESGSAGEIESWNPKSYLKAVKYANTSDQFHLFEENLNTLGGVKLYVYLEKGLSNRTSYFRKPGMVVYKQTRKKINGYSAVFICKNEVGNEILRLMENPAHNEWKKENYPKEEGRIDTKARRAEKEISDFINKSLESLSKIKPGKKIAFLELEEYLSIPEDLLEKDEEFDFDGGVTNTDKGNTSKEISEEETAMQTTIKFTPVKIKATTPPKSRVQKDDDVTQDDDGDLNGSGGGDGSSGDGSNAGPGSGDRDETGVSPTEQPTDIKVLIPIGLRVAAQIEDTFLYHNLIINSENEVCSAELELLVGGDNDRDDSVEILSTDKGNVTKNIIKDVKLNCGKNFIKVRFADNLKHSIKIKAYELQ